MLSLRKIFDIMLIKLGLGVSMKNIFLYQKNKGMSLIEVMIILTVMSLISLGMATLFKNMTSVQNRTSTKTVLYEIQHNVEEAIRNDTAWSLAVNDGANAATMTCLRDGNTCADGFSPAGNLRIYDAAGAIEFDGSSGTAGWDLNGQPCNTFNAGGNDDCPFRYELRLTAQCPPGVNPCPKPIVTVTGQLTFAPDEISDLENRINTNNYQVRIERGVAHRFEPFELRFADIDPNGNQGGGECNQNNWQPRPLNQVVDLGGADNVNMNVAAAGVVPTSATPPAGVGEFTLQPGSYECNVIAQAFEADEGFQVRLRDMSNTVGPFDAGGAYTSNTMAVFSSGTVQFRISSARTFRLEHYCRGNSWKPYNPIAMHAPKNPRTFHMGIPVANYGVAEPSIYTTISCVRSS